MANESEKAKNEREAFQLFAERLGLRHEWLSIESRKPDEPDLLCVHVNNGPIAFELVRICDPNIAKVIAAGPKARQEAFSTADPSERIVREKLKKTGIRILLWVRGQSCSSSIRRSNVGMSAPRLTSLVTVLISYSSSIRPNDIYMMPSLTSSNRLRLTFTFS